MIQHANPAQPAAASKNQVAIAWRHMIGVALLWFALASLSYLAGEPAGPYRIAVSLAGFLAFAGGLSLVLNALRRAIVEDIAALRR